MMLRFVIVSHGTAMEELGVDLPKLHFKISI